MAKTDEKPKSYPPIIPFATLTNFTEVLKNTAVPPVVDGSLLTKMAGSMRSSLMSSLRFLGLISGTNHALEPLHALVKAYGTDGWQDALIQLLMPAYEEITEGVNLDSGTGAQLYDAFRTRGGVEGQMLEKAVRFYLSLMTEAGAKYSPHFKSKTIRKPSAKKPKPKGRTVIDELDDPDDDLRDDVDGEIVFDARTYARFQIPIPGDKGTATIVLPKSLDADDWQMVKLMLDAYVGRQIKTGGV